MIIHNNQVHNIIYMFILLQTQERFYGSHWFVYRYELEYEKVGDYLLKYENSKYTLAIIQDIETNLVDNGVLYNKITIDIIGELVSVYIDDYDRVKSVILRNNKIIKLV